jgi:hypothetical protein
MALVDVGVFIGVDVSLVGLVSLVELEEENLRACRGLHNHSCIA